MVTFFCVWPVLKKRAGQRPAGPLFYEHTPTRILRHEPLASAALYNMRGWPRFPKATVHASLSQQLGPLWNHLLGTLGLLSVTLIQEKGGQSHPSCNLTDPILTISNSWLPPCRCVPTFFNTCMHMTCTMWFKALQPSPRQAANFV